MFFVYVLNKDNVVSFSVFCPCEILYYRFDFQDCFFESSKKSDSSISYALRQYYVDFSSFSYNSKDILPILIKMFQTG